MTWTGGFGRACGWLLDKIVHGLALSRISPNALTFIGLMINIVAAFFFGHADATNAGRMFFYAGLVIIGAGLFDMVDGRVARRTGQGFRAMWNGRAGRGAFGPNGRMHRAGHLLRAEGGDFR